MFNEQTEHEVTKLDKYWNGKWPIVLHTAGLGISALSIAIDIINKKPIDTTYVTLGLVNLSILVDNIFSRAGYKANIQEQEGKTR